MKHLLPNALYFKLYKHNRNRWDKNKHNKLYDRIKIATVFAFFAGVSYMITINLNIAFAMTIVFGIIILIIEMD